MAVSTTNLIQGPATIYIGAFGSTEPTDANINTIPSTPWVDLGGTSDGITMTVNLTVDQLAVDQVLEIPQDVITGRNVTINTNLAEATLTNFARAWNLDETAAVTTGTSPAGSIFEPASDVSQFRPIYHALILDGIAPGGYRRRVIVRRAIQTGAVGVAYSKTNQTFMPVSFRSTYVSSTVKPVRIVDAIA